MPKNVMHCEGSDGTRAPAKRGPWSKEEPGVCVAGITVLNTSPPPQDAQQSTIAGRDESHAQLDMRTHHPCEPPGHDK